MIKAIVFDVGGVLHYSSLKYIFQDIMQALKITEKALRGGLDKNIEKLEKGQITEEQFWEIFLKKTKSKNTLPEESLLLKKFIQYYRRNDKVINLAKKLKSNGYRIVILSNSIISHAEYQHKIGIYQDFNPIILSYKVGMRKPDLEIYRYLLKKLQLRPKEVFFVDDVNENVEAATKLGIHTELFKDTSQLEANLKRLGVKI